MGQLAQEEQTQYIKLHYQGLFIYEEQMYEVPKIWYLSMEAYLPGLPSMNPTV